jgi:hypothetical protein
MREKLSRRQRGWQSRTLHTNKRADVWSLTARRFRMT